MKKKLPYLQLPLVYVALLLAVLLNSVCFGQSNSGTDFWFGFIGDNDTPTNGYAVNITSFYSTTGTFTIPGSAYTVPFTVTPGAVTRFTIPNNYVDNNIEGTVNQACHITSVLPIAPYYSEESGGPRDGNTYLLPDTLFGNDYYVMSYTLTASADEQDPSEVIVTAPGNTVTVVITPTANTDAGHAAGFPYNVTLGPNQVYLVRGANYGDLTGTHITAATPSDPTQKFSVISGSDIAGAGCASTVDGMFNELIPTYTWGKSYIFVSSEWVDDLCRVLAETNGTQVSINGTVVATLNVGQYYQTTVPASTPAFITANNPISVGRIMQDESCNNYTSYPPRYAEGDADFSILMPNEDMYIDSVTYYCNLINGIERNFLQIMSRTSDISTYKLDGVPIPSSKFTPLAFNPAYSYDTMEVTTAAANGTNHELTTTGCGFIAYCNGMGSVASYCSAIGLYLRNLTNLSSGLASATSTPAGCSGCNGTATVNVAGGLSPFSYSWSDASSQTTQTATGLCSGTYTVIVQERCDIENDTAIVVVGGNGASSFSMSATPDTLCAGASTTVSVSGGGPGTTYQWSNSSSSTTSSFTVSPTTTTTYTVTINNGGCPPIDTNITVTVNPLPVVIVSPDNPSICIGGNVALTASGAVNYSWSPATGLTCTTCANPTASPTGTTLYTITGTDAHGCTSSTTATVNIQENPPVISLTAIPKVICEGSTVALQASATGITAPFTWQPGGMTGGSISVTPTVTTTYTVTAPSDCGTSTDTVTITVNDLPIPAFSADITNGCAPLCVQFRDESTTSEGNIIQWTWNYGNGDSSIEQNPIYCYPKGGIYSVGLTTLLNTGCSASLKIVNYINIYSRPAAGFSMSPLPATILTPTIQFTDKSTDPSGIIQWWWTFGDQTDSVSTQQDPIHTYQDTGTYCPRLVATDQHGCTDTATNCIAINPAFLLYIPDAFTPNGDGRNDVFMAKGNDIKSFEMYIFDRWGTQLFHSTNINDGWNGKINNTGTLCQEDTYVYLINAYDNKNHKHSYTGKLNLLK